MFFFFIFYLIALYLYVNMYIFSQQKLQKCIKRRNTCQKTIPRPTFQKSKQNNQSMKKTQICSWIAFCRNVNEGRILKIMPRNFNEILLSFIFSSLEKNGIQEFHLPSCVCLLYCNENPIYVFPEKLLRGLSPHFHIDVSVIDLNISRIRSLFRGNI